MKSNSILLSTVICLLSFSCTNTNPASYLLVSTKGILVSCTKCGCMDDVLKTYLSNTTLGDIKVYGDQECFPDVPSLEFINLSQQQIDSIKNKTHTKTDNISHISKP